MESSWWAYSRRSESPILGASFTPFDCGGDCAPECWDGVAAASSMLGKEGLL